MLNYKKFPKEQCKVANFCEGSREKNCLAFSYEIGLSPSIKSDKSMSKVGPRFPSSAPNDTCGNKKDESGLEKSITFRITVKVSYLKKINDKTRAIYSLVRSN